MTTAIKRWHAEPDAETGTRIIGADGHALSPAAIVYEFNALASTLAATAIEREAARRDRDAAREEVAELRQQRDHHARQRSIEGIDARVALDAAMGGLSRGIDECREALTWANSSVEHHLDGEWIKRIRRIVAALEVRALAAQPEKAKES